MFVSTTYASTDDSAFEQYIFVKIFGNFLFLHKMRITRNHLKNCQEIDIIEQDQMDKKFPSTRMPKTALCEQRRAKV